MTGGSQANATPMSTKHSSDLKLRDVVGRLLRRAGLQVRQVEIATRGSSGSAVRILTIPGVYGGGNDSDLIAEALSAEKLTPGAVVLDICAGSGILSIVAARLGAGMVNAVDISRRAMICTRLNGFLNHAAVRTRRGDLFAALDKSAMFDVIISNPPWLPSATDELPTRGDARAWDAGRDGRALIDRVCAGAASRLRSGGFLLLVQPSVCDIPATVKLLSLHGLKVNIVVRRLYPMTPLLRERAQLLQNGPWSSYDSTYELVVIRASRPPHLS